VAASPAVSLGRLRLTGEQADPAIDSAVDEAVARTGIEVTDLVLDNWRDALSATFSLMDVEVIAADGGLLDDPVSRAKLGADVRQRMLNAAKVTPEQADYAREFQRSWRSAFDRLFTAAQLLALPVPAAHRLPASLQLIGPAGSEELLLATGAVIEAAAGYRRT
jgi:amidase